MGDTPYRVLTFQYVANADNLDNCQLMSPWMHMVGDVNGDGKVGLENLTLLASACNSKP
jgi:hypothetical protein